ncbi:MAG: exopolysaccharide biosynthesis protein [Rhizobiaceae bacterium]
MDDMTAESVLRVANPPRRLSTIISQLAAEAEGPISVERIRNALDDRSFAAMLALFAILNLLPFPPGTTLILGPPLVIVAAQMALGLNRLWLPRMILDKSLGRDRFRALSRRHLPRLLKLERLIKPRNWPFSGRDWADRFIGWICLVLSIAVTLPVPLGNWLPALSVLLIALALSERDGMLFYAGILLGILSLIIIAAVIGTAGAIAGMLFS